MFLIYEQTNNEFYKYIYCKILKFKIHTFKFIDERILKIFNDVFVTLTDI